MQLRTATMADEAVSVTQTDKLSFLATQIMQLKTRAFNTTFEPAPSSDSWIFYVYLIVQQCGTGTRTKDDTLSCGDIWRIYIKDWNDKRYLFTQHHLTFANFSKLYNDSGSISVVSRLFTRYLMHLEIQRTLGTYDTRILTEPILDTTASYGEIDVWSKKLNLFRMIVLSRADEYNATVAQLCSTGPVIDYHVMRVFLRLLGLELPTDITLAEQQLRHISYSMVQKLVDNHNLEYLNIDTYLWNLGRECCTYCSPSCVVCSLSSICAKNLHQEPRIDTFAY